MKEFTKEQLLRDRRKVCVYNDVCDTTDNKYCECMNFTDEMYQYLGEVLYGKEAKLIK